MGKYEGLSQFLAAARGDVQRLTFSEIERALGFKLPKSAYEYPAWWSNNPAGHSHSRAWTEAGWRTEAVDLSSRKVTFQRAVESRHVAEMSPKRDPWGCMADSVTLLPDVDLTAPSGEVWNAEQGRLLDE
jgi:hypothetical protein